MTRRSLTRIIVTVIDEMHIGKKREFFVQKKEGTIVVAKLKEIE